MNELIGADGKKLPHTIDARIWAKEFVTILKQNNLDASDEGWMISWFANSIMAGWDEAERRERNRSIWQKILRWWRNQ